MATNHLDDVIQYLRDAVRYEEMSKQTDAQLLTRFVSLRDEAALEAIVRRHGPMVWGVCRRFLSHHHDAEDAFQATFLVFVRRAASIVPREMLSPWLHGVASQTARKARALAGKRYAKERQVIDMPEPAAATETVWRDLQPVLDEELHRLPEKYQVAIILCDLEGKTRKEAARQLGCPEGTLAARLTRGRTMLAKRLARRGLAISGAALAGVLAQNAVSASVPPMVVASTIKAAMVLATGNLAVAAGLSAKAAVISDAVVKALFMAKLKTACLLLITTGLLITTIGVGAGLLSSQESGVSSQESGVSDQAVTRLLTADSRLLTPDSAPPQSDTKADGGSELAEAENFAPTSILQPAAPQAGIRRSPLTTRQRGKEVNLIENASLEDPVGPDGLPQGWKFTVTPPGPWKARVVDGGRTGHKSLFIEGPGGGCGVVTTTRIAIDRTKRYFGRGWLRLEGDGSSRATIKFDYYEGKHWLGQTHVGDIHGPTKDWTAISLTDRATHFPKATTLSFSVELNNGKAWFDDLELYAREAPASANLLRNGDMEIIVGNRPAGWSVSAGDGAQAVIRLGTDAPLEGKCCLLFKGKADQAVARSEKIKLDSAKTYTLTGFVHVKSGKGRIRLDYFHDNKLLEQFCSDEWTELDRAGTSANDQWHQAQVIVKPRQVPGATHIAAAAVGAGNFEVLFDDFVLTAR